MPYAVCVTFRTLPGAMGRFLPLMLENAGQSRDREPGCLRFDVLSDPDHPDEVFLYEIYSDRAAFDAHLGSAHFRAFDAAVADLVADKVVRTWRGVAP